VTPLAHVGFTSAHGASVWDEVKTLTPAQAIDAVKDHFNWHLAETQVAGVKLRGAHVLELAPFVLPVLLGLLLARIRRAATSYSPFSTDVPEAAPRVGFDQRTLELLTIVILPLLAVASAGAALVLIGRLPVLGGLTALACLGLGTAAFARLGDLREQTRSIVHSHSMLPPVARADAARQQAVNGP
jgi:hypothetical protein